MRGSSSLTVYSEFLNSSSPNDHGAANIVDVTAFPWVYRLYVIEHYKGLSVSNDGEGKQSMLKEKVDAWLKRMEEIPAVRDTLAEKNKLLETYARYADGSAKSQVGVAVMQGREAHVV